MFNLEEQGFIKLTWEGKTLISPEMKPFVPYWACFVDGTFLSPVIWHPYYKGIVPLESFDIDLYEDGTWGWDYVIEVDSDGNIIFPPHSDWTYIKRIESPLPEELRRKPLQS